MASGLRAKVAAKLEAGVDAIEAETIARVIQEVREEFLDVADRHRTADTEDMVRAAGLIVISTLERLTPAKARKINSAHDRGEEISFGDIDSEMASKAAEYDKLKDPSNRSDPKGLGAGSSADAILEQLRLLLERDPRIGQYLPEILTSLLENPDTSKARAILALEIARGTHPQWMLVMDPASGQMLPACLVDAYAKIKQHETTITNGDKQLQGLQDQLNPQVTDSAGWKATQFDLNVDPRNPKGHQATLDALTAERDAARQQLANVQAPTNMVERQKIADKVKELQEALGRVIGARKDQAEAKLNELARMVKPPKQQ